MKNSALCGVFCFRTLTNVVSVLPAGFSQFNFLSSLLICKCICFNSWIYLSVSSSIPFLNNSNACILSSEYFIKISFCLIKSEGKSSNLFVLLIISIFSFHLGIVFSSNSLSKEYLVPVFKLL